MKMKKKLIHNSTKMLLLVLIIPLLFSCGRPVISTETPDTLVDTPIERWAEYEAAILAACYSDVSLRAEKLCEWDIITQRDNIVYVWVFCANSGGCGFSGPRTIHINSDGDVEKATCPRVFDDYKTLFPGDLYEQIMGYQSRFDLDKAWSHLERRFQDRTIPPLIVVEGTPLP